jgi:transglutaminase-like putative cysteine protease
MLRTVLLYLLPAFLVATHWERLEEGGEASGRFLWMVVLALAPALVRPLWARIVVLIAAAAVAAGIALRVWPGDARPFDGDDYFGPLLSRFWKGSTGFFDVELPFNPSDHPLMHGAILLAVFAFCVVISLAIATRRPLLAASALIAGAGWPATILVEGAQVARGAVILGAALLLFAGMRALPTRDLRQPLLAGGAVVLAAVVLSTSPSVARGEFVDGWRQWDVPGRRGPSVGVEYVWNANYRGIRFPDTPTTVLSIQAPEQAGVYWRATTLDTLEDGRWVEQLHGGAEPVRADGVDNLTDDPFLPAAADERDNWIEADVQVEALRDAHLVGASMPVAYASGGRDVDYYLGNVAVAREAVRPGDSYTVFSYAAQPTPRELARSEPRYPDFLSSMYLAVEGVSMPPFGSPNREAELQEIVDRDPRVRRYAGVYSQARDLVGDASNPYAATVALETWFRSGGDFAYDEQPGRNNGLVRFVTSTRRGYCQHFAGAMALMLRQLGIPARVAAGFTSGRYDRDERRWIVADRNAHTWVEAYFHGFGWLPFDPTPGRGQLGAAYTSSSFNFDVGGAQDAIGGVSTQVSDLLRGEGGGPDRQRGLDPGRAEVPSSGGSDRRRDGTGILIILLAATLAAALLLAFAKLVRRGVRFLTRDPRGIAAACRRDLAGFMADQGVPVPASATPSELGGLVQQQFGVDSRSLVDALTVARFGPPEGAAAAAAGARRELRRVRRMLRARLSLPRRTRGLLSIRSLTA